MIGLSYYKYVAKLVKKIKLNTTRIIRMLVVFNIIFFTRFVTLTQCYTSLKFETIMYMIFFNSGEGTLMLKQNNMIKGFSTSL